MKNRVIANHARREQGKRKTTKGKTTKTPSGVMYTEEDVAVIWDKAVEQVKVLRQSRARLVRLVRAYRVKWIHALVKER